jgi:prenyltransferase beta subunit
MLLSHAYRRQKGYLHKDANHQASWLAIIIVLLVLSSAVGAGLQAFQSPPPMRGSPRQDSYTNSSPSSPYFLYPTSCIHIAIIYDVSTGAQVYADAWKSLLTNYGYNVSEVPFQQILVNPILVRGYDLILVDHSCGGDAGLGITLEKTTALTESDKPIILLGGAHGVIDRLANYSGGMGQVSVTGIVQKALDRVDHQAYLSPYFISDAGVGPPNSIGIFGQTVSLESYPENAVNNLFAFSLLEGAPKPVIAALYSSCGNSGRIFWWAFKDPLTLSTNGRNLFVNTVEWMGGLTDLELVHSYLQEAESFQTSKSAYWTGGIGDCFDPQIPATYYALESLRLIGRLYAINSSDLVNWLTGFCYSVSDGYFRSPNRYVSPSLWSGVTETGMAIRILSTLSALNRVNLTRVSAYIGSCQLADGFVNHPGDSSKSITNTYWALMALNGTGALNTINQSKTISYVLSCQSLNPSETVNYGGFADYPGGISSAESTFMALVSLNLLGALNALNQTVVEHWLMNGYIESKNLFYEEHLPNNRGTVNYGTGYSIASLAILGRLGDIDRALVAGYLSSVQFTDGGWSGANCTDEPVEEIADCYPVMLGLKQLDRVNTIRDMDGLVGFLLRCLSPSPTYGFSNLPKTLSNTWQTYNGICILYDLGLLNISQSISLCNSLVSSYNHKYDWFEWFRSSYPKSSDGYTDPSFDSPFEYSFLQRGGRGVIMTDLAITALLNLGYENWTSLHAQEIWNKIIQCEVTAGPYAGYYEYISGAQITNLTTGLRYTYYAIDCLWALARYLNYTSDFTSHLANATTTISKIMSLYNPSTGAFDNDGYILEPYSPVETTYMALASLKLLNSLSHVDTAKTTEFLQAHLYSNLVDTYYSFKALQTLSKLAKINTTNLLECVKDTENPDGAFKSSGEAPYRLETTRMAIEILNYCNQTWIAAKQMKLIINSLQMPATMRLGMSYLVNLTLIDSKFNAPLTEASVKIGLGTYEYIATEMPTHSGRYTISLSVPIDGRLFGSQCLAFRCSKGTYQTNIAKTTVEVRMNDGGDGKVPTQIDFIQPDLHSHLSTCNTSTAISICSFNGTQIPVIGAQVILYVNSSFTETSLSNSSGWLGFSWRPSSSGTYYLKAIFDGSDLLNASEASRTIWVDKTPTMISLCSNSTSTEITNIGHTLQLNGQLSEKIAGKPIGSAAVSFVVLTPSGARTSFVATTGRDGLASATLTVNENGTYTIYSKFESTSYYSGSTSNSLSFEVRLESEGGGGGGNGPNSGDTSWVVALLSALATPLGAGLAIASGGLLTIAHLVKAKRRELESIDRDVDQQRRRHKKSMRSS